MLEFYARIAKRLYGAKPLFGAIAGLGLAVFVALMFLPDVPDGPTYGFLSITMALWSFFLVVVIHQFSLPIPVAAPGAGFLARLRIRLRRAVLLVSAIVMTAMAIVIAAYTSIAVAALLRTF